MRRADVMPTPATAPSTERRILTALIIDGSTDDRETIRGAYVDAGYHVHAVAEGDTGLILARETNPDVVVVDLDLPQMSGGEVIRQLRLTSMVPIVVVSARRTERDRIRALKLGADDVMGKPASVQELLARTEAVLRRSAFEQIEQLANAEEVTFGDCELNLTSNILRRHGIPVALRPQERLLLEFFARRPGQTFSRDQILDVVWGTGSNVTIRTVDVHVRWLREKIEDEPSNPRHLITVRRGGYRFEREPVEAAPVPTPGWLPSFDQILAFPAAILSGPADDLVIAGLMVA